MILRHLEALNEITLLVYKKICSMIIMENAYIDRKLICFFV